MTTQNISVRADADVIARIDELARAEDRSRNWWINQALKEALEREEAWARQVERGVAAAEAGDFASEEEVSAVFRRYGR